ncbi:hypothetical protein BCO26_0097 [Heyndrickxia coagulans 2-6]|nr:hypothetical protein BCO26_0097 [Heyndrickxia coagulans 2-6]
MQRRFFFKWQAPLKKRSVPIRLMEMQSERNFITGQGMGKKQTKGE